MPIIDKAKVIEYMAKKGITTFKELAEALGVSPTQLSNILSDKFEPVKANVIELAEFLELSPIDIIKERDEAKENK